uniref:Uncharacterized protein n=1 Tax=Arundo donax TaxID=35708 RepID=A0A0A9EPN1_ARUDO
MLISPAPACRQPLESQRH